LNCLFSRDKLLWCISRQQQHSVYNVTLSILCRNVAVFPQLFMLFRLIFLSLFLWATNVTHTHRSFSQQNLCTKFSNGVQRFYTQIFMIPYETTSCCSVEKRTWGIKYFNTNAVLKTKRKTIYFIFHSFKDIILVSKLSYIITT
jgi:hypothetical protein